MSNGLCVWQPWVTPPGAAPGGNGAGIPAAIAALELTKALKVAEAASFMALLSVAGLVVAQQAMVQHLQAPPPPMPVPGHIANQHVPPPPPKRDVEALSGPSGPVGPALAPTDAAVAPPPHVTWSPPPPIQFGPMTPFGDAGAHALRSAQRFGVLLTRVHGGASLQVPSRRRRRRSRMRRILRAETMTYPLLTTLHLR